jgi:hypothetical protein
MIELDSQKLDPFNFPLWEKIKDTARKRRKSQCNWKPFIVSFMEIVDSLEKRSKSKIYKGQEIKIMTIFYTTETPVTDMAKEFGGTSVSITKIAESHLVALIKLARESLTTLPCQVYDIRSKEIDEVYAPSLKVSLFKADNIFARSPEEAIKLCQQYRPESLKYSLEVRLTKHLGCEVKSDSNEITFI